MPEEKAVAVPEERPVPTVSLDEKELAAVRNNIELLERHVLELLEPDRDYTIKLWPEQNRAQLLDAGAKTIRAFYGVIAKPHIEEADVVLDGENPRIRYRVLVELISPKLGRPVAYAYAVASTEELKYKYRRYGADRLVEELRSEGLEEEEIRNVLKNLKKKTHVRYEKGKKITITEYYLRNEDVSDLENTILRMAVKRASVAATRELPGVDRIFNRPKEWWAEWERKRKTKLEEEKEGRPGAKAPEAKSESSEDETKLESSEAETRAAAEAPELEAKTETPETVEEVLEEDISQAEFNVRFKELNISNEEAKRILGVDSLRDWFAKGRTRREALEVLRRYIEERKEYQDF